MFFFDVELLQTISLCVVWFVIYFDTAWLVRIQAEVGGQYAYPCTRFTHAHSPPQLRPWGLSNLKYLCAWFVHKLREMIDHSRLASTDTTGTLCSKCKAFLRW
jgi:hypothetical protein